jgi:hypothetical protein
VNFCRKLATELGFIQPGPTPIAEDNTGAIALLEHGHFKGRSKHVHLRWCFVCDYVNTGVLRLVQTPTRDQLADIGTKSCPDLQLKFHVLYFAVVFDSIVASPRASSSRRLSLLRAKWLLAHQTRLVLSTLPVSSALYSCILELRGGI